MATEWYYSRDEQRFGPVSVMELRELASSGDIEPADLVWKEGMSAWVPATKVKGLFAKSSGGKHTETDSLPTPGVDWYFTTNGQQQGPVAVERLRRLITPSDLVWKEGLPEWVPASTIPNLFPNPRTPPLEPDGFPGVSSAIPPSASRTKSAHPKLLIWGALSLVLLIGVVLAAVFFRTETDPRITEDYFPRSLESERSSVCREFAPDGSTVTSRRTFRWKDEGTLDGWDRDNPKERFVSSWRTNKGFIELQVVKQKDGDGEWEPCLKIGAKPGDTWDRQYETKGHGSVSFRYEEFKTHQKRPCVVIAYELKNGSTTVQGHRWYLKGIGLVRDEGRIQQNGSWRPHSEFVFAEWDNEPSTPIVAKKSTESSKDELPVISKVDFSKGPKGEVIAKVEEANEQKSGFKNKNGTFVRHGPCVLFYDRIGGKKRWEGERYNGQWHGKLTGWYENGSLWFERWYDKGTPVGTHKGYDGKDKINWELRFDANGKPNIGEVDCYCVVSQVAFLYGSSEWTYFHPHNEDRTLYQFKHGVRSTLVQGEFIRLLGSPQQAHNAKKVGMIQYEEWVYRCKDGTVHCVVWINQDGELVWDSLLKVSGRRKF